jgi:hypothetical protein
MLVKYLTVQLDHGPYSVKLVPLSLDLGIPGNLFK